MDQNEQKLRVQQEFYRGHLPFFLNKDFSACYKHKLYKWQQEFLLCRKLLRFVTAANQVGKDCHIDALIPTPDGMRVYGDIKVGDSVFGRDGKPTKVLATKRFNDQKCYRITFDDQTSIIAGEGHLWVCKGSKERFRKKYKSHGKEWDNPDLDKWVVKSTKQMIQEGGYDPGTKAYKRFVIPIPEPVEYEERKLFDPYLVGLLIGNGCLSSGNRKLSTIDHEVVDYIQSKYSVRQEKSKPIDYTIRGISEEIRGIGLDGHTAATKFIPEPYLLGSIEQRKALLQGLMDTDGSAYGKGIMEYSTISKQLAEDVAELVRSLGGKAEVKGPRITQYTHKGEKKDGQPSYRIYIKTLFNPFRVKRKADRWYQTRYKHEKVIYSIEPVETVPTMCISVDNEDHTYLIGREYIVTHNSTAGILLCINMAVRKDLWGYWFPRREPKTFCYLYPDSKLATVEFSSKWTEYLPKGPMKTDPRYGWQETYGDKGQIESIVFNSGVTVYFRFYSQKVSSLQAHSFDAVFLDEETPQDHYDELQVRCQATQALGSGYISMFFTATLGQVYLFNCMEMQGTNVETFKGAYKRQISAYDCITYCDGSPGDIYSKEYIEKELIPKYRNQREILRRIWGRFVKSSGLIYEEFDPTKNTEKLGDTDMDGWRSWVGIDYGSGGEYGHSSAIVHVKVDPTYSKARVVSVWSSQKKRMTQSDLLTRYKEMLPEFGLHQAFADWGATDLFTLAARESIRLEKAEKSHDIGINLLNTLFQGEQLKIIHHPNSHSVFLIQELQSITEEQNKRHRVDDCSDALRYAISLCPMRLTALKIQEQRKAEDLSKINPRLLFYRGLDRKDDPLVKTDADDEDELERAIQEFEDIL